MLRLGTGVGAGALAALGVELGFEEARRPRDEAPRPVALSGEVEDVLVRARALAAGEGAGAVTRAHLRRAVTPR